ncbi:MAG TPA: homoserine dehydrogenase, partial [Desulfuromonadaceae bacterium]
FGTRIDFNSIYTEGITRISGLDVKFASEFGYRIKLLAIGKFSDGQVEARVHPTMIPLHNPLADVNGVFNAIRLTGDFVGPVMFYGRGAGQNPTASAIVGDLIGLSRSMLAGAGRRIAPLGFLDSEVGTIPVKPMADIVSKYMLRFSALDQPGVLAAIAGSLGRHGISIESMVQTSHQAGDSAPVPIVIMTHEAREGAVQAALAEIDRFDIICQKTSFIRIEDNLE